MHASKNPSSNKYKIELNKLLTKLRPSLFKLAYYWTKNRYDADDIVQEAYEKIWRNAKKGIIKENQTNLKFFRWILRCVWVDHIRHKKSNKAKTTYGAILLSGEKIDLVKTCIRGCETDRNCRDFLRWVDGQSRHNPVIKTTLQLLKHGIVYDKQMFKEQQIKENYGIPFHKYERTVDKLYKKLQEFVS